MYIFNYINWNTRDTCIIWCNGSILKINNEYYNLRK